MIFFKFLSFCCYVYLFISFVDSCVVGDLGLALLEELGSDGAKLYWLLLLMLLVLAFFHLVFSDVNGSMCLRLEQASLEADKAL